MKKQKVYIGEGGEYDGFIFLLDHMLMWGYLKTFYFKENENVLTGISHMQLGSTKLKYIGTL